MEIPLDSPKEDRIEKLDAALDILHSAESNISGLLSGLDRIISATRDDFVELEVQKEYLESQKQALQEKTTKQEHEISGLTNEQHKLLVEYAQVKEELEKFTKIASDSEEISLDDMRATLSIYRALFEEIYASQPHFKVLYLLHGDAETMSVDHLKSASGIGGAMILRACHELKKANLIDFNMDTKQAKLIQRLFHKKNEN